uniref:NBS-LRR disease resistance protein n=1 Tax=Dasypyrum villosum TaxID=40247 RepID=A0A8K1IB26_9POAL|nr:NBS-LRR disease resistance protein [Dasypyrum villosum]
MHAALSRLVRCRGEQLDRQVKHWADEVRELSYNMEDVVDKFLVRVRRSDRAGRHLWERDQDLLSLLSIEGDDASNKKLKKISIVGFGGLGKTLLLEQYLVIIDDIWDEKLWEGINLAFSNRNNLGSRLITTTRIVSVSNSCCSSADDSIYKMEPLSTDDSRRLFYKRIFPNNSGCPNEFQQVSEDILKKCGGVPLAIITIASVLASGQQVKPKCEWDILLQSLGSGLTKDNSLEEMRRILSFSYYNLPSHLKTCLLYLCIYPEDSKIGRDRLIWKWVAEGFVHHGNQGTSLFLLGLNYFNQLINRSMIQPIYDVVGQVHACRVHDMVLDLICNLSQEAKFVNVLDGTGDSMSFQGNVRRLSLQDRNKDHEGTPLRNFTGISRVRSITIFTSVINIMPALSRFEVLRVLDLSDCNLGKSSSLQLNLKGVGHLVHLRYLGLAGTGIRELSAEIGNLQFLEVLDLERNYEIDELPSTLFKLRRLIYLNVWLDKVVPTPGVLQNLASIEVLRGVLVSLNIIAQELGNLTGLRELQIRFDDGGLDLYEGFVKSLCNLHHIESLCIHRDSRETSFGLMDLLGERWVPPVHLREFVSYKPSKLSALRGWIKRDPTHLSNLSELFLISVKEVQQEDVEIIGGLLSLRRLFIKITHQTQRLLVIRADGFRCMVVFHLDCGSAAQIMFESGALPRAEVVAFSLGVRVTKEDGNCGFDLGLQGNLLSLQRRVKVYMYCGGARVGEAKEAKAAVRHALDAHPNHPLISIYMLPPIPEGANDDDLCEDMEN